MRRKSLIVAVSIIIFIFISCFIYVFAGTKKSERLMWEFLEEKGYKRDEIKNLDVKHSFLNIILSYNEWSVHVRYADEPDVIYSYPVKNGQIKEPGISGKVEKEELKHK
jgi:hypothetical protein